MQIINSPEIMQKTALDLRRQDRKIGFVPTMGFLHNGHISLVKIARREADVVVLSIFVNPRQFGPNEDFNRYPHDLARDSELCRQNGVDIIFHPSVEDMYPDFLRRPDTLRDRDYGGQVANGFAARLSSPESEANSSSFKVFVDEKDLSKQLCGASRPGHFSGVLTVVGKLFNLVLPDTAVFGQKDAQQAILIQRMIKDLDFPVRMVVAPIIRENDGLAMSSRNVYLSPDERRAALCLSAALRLGRRLYRSGERDGGAIKDAIIALIKKEKMARMDYVEVVNIHDLNPVSKIEGGNILIALAVFIEKTRLIDNLPLPDDRLGNLPEE